MFCKLGAPWALLLSRRGQFLWPCLVLVPCAPLRPCVGSRAASQGVDAWCVALVPAWAIWKISQAAHDTCVDAAQFACTLLATDSSHGTLPEREEENGGTPRAAVVDGGETRTATARAQ